MPLAALDFPASPTIGQLYPDPPVTGQPTYKWDGTLWLAYRAAPLDATVPYAPFSALGWSGMQINGSMEVSQENGTAVVPVGSGTVTKYIIDGWQVIKSGTSVLSAYRDPAPGLYGFNSSLQLHASTAQPSIGSDYVRFATPLEGYRISRVAWGTAAALPITVGFWVRFMLPGTYRALIYNFDASAVTPWVPFTVNTSMAWQWVTIQFPAQTTGTWKADNTIGAVFLIEVASSATPNTVSAVNQYAAITGVVVLPGLEAPTAVQSPNIMRPYDQELLACKRYYEKSYDYAVSPGTASNISGCSYWLGIGAATGNTIGLSAAFGVSKRAQPTMTWYSTTTGASGKLRSGGGAELTAVNIAIGDHGATVYAVTTATESQMLGHWTADARL